MKNLRNFIMLGLLAVFFAGYGFVWAYQSLYREPRQRLQTEMTQYRQGLEKGKQEISMMQQIIGQNQMLYFRSMPRIQNDVRSKYQFWFLEALKYCGIENQDFQSDNPTRTRFGGWNYRFHVRGNATLDQLSRLLFEFYCVPYLHRITTMSVVPVEGKEEQITFSMTVDALSIPYRYQNDPYPLLSDLPTGYWPRLASRDLNTYQVIADRNLLQAAKGGVDKADYTYLTAINYIGKKPEIWLSVRTDESIVKAGRGDSVRIGSFRARIVEILEEDVVFERDGMRWLVSLGDCLNQAFALPPEVYWNEENSESSPEISTVSGDPALPK